MDVQQTRFSAQEITDLAQRIDRPIVLVGMMGVGKSSIGKRLAGLLDWAFVDVDDEIERSAQMTVPEIFETFGEDYFRDGERRVIARLINETCNDGIAARGGLVMATGGGAFCNAETRAMILDRAITVWLDSEIDTLLERTSRKDNRPLLRNGDPRETLTRLRAEREPYYAQAPIHVISSNVPATQTINKVLQEIARWG